MMRLLRGTNSIEDSRTYLQTRLAVLWKVMFWAFVILVSCQWVLYELVYPEIRPKHQTAIYVLASVGLAVMAFIWRGLLVRRTLSINALFVIDLVYGTASGLVLGAVACLAFDFPPSHYTCLIYASFGVFTRAILLPSSARWTAITAIATFFPMVVAAAALAKFGDVVAPGPVFFVGALVLSGVAVLLASTGSRVINALNQKVSAAKQVGQYTLERKIGQGGMGAVYLARHILLRRPTAVKLLLPERVGLDNLERFEREVQAMSQLTHPNTVAVYDYGRSPEGIFYYAMEYLGGGVDLEHLVRDHGSQPAGRVAAILVQVCGALQEAHEAKLIHRDVTPRNIILCERGGMPDVAKVVDYGLVKEITADGSDSTQIILGTPAYIAPEAVTDPKSITPAADIYALGAVGYFLLTGHRVFEGKTAIDVCIQKVTKLPKPPSEVATQYVPPTFEAILMRCLQREPTARFGSAAEMAAALKALPPLHDWSEEEAKRWWRDFREVNDTSTAIAPSPMTITVDLGTRGIDVT